MRRGTLTALLACLVALCAAGPAVAAERPWYQDGPDGRILMNDDWLFRADPGDIGIAEGWFAQADSAGWSAVTIPNAWNAGDDSAESMAGSIGWYRRDFTVPGRPRGADWIVRFESVNYHAAVFLNGTLIAEHEAASIPFEVPLEGLRRGVNSLVVRVDSRRGPADLPPGPTGGWWNYGGILREVYLRPVDQVDIAEVLTRAVAKDALLVRVTLSNPGGGLKRARVSAEVAGQDVGMGSVRVSSGHSRTVSKRVRIPGAQPWEPGDPHLYEVRVEAEVHGRRVAGYTVHTGLRLLRVGRDGRLRLNGKPLNLRGASIHEQTPERGAALTPRDHAAQIRMLKELGATVTRSHYPLSADFLERADRAGIMVWEEMPFYQLAESVMRLESVREQGYAYLETAIRRDQNHPSVLVWSIGNELPPSPRRGQTSYIAHTTALAHRLDPTRPVAMAVAGYPVKNHVEAYERLDAIGINDYFGWYPGPKGQINNRAALGQYLDRMRGFYPQKALFVTEFGAEGNRFGPADEKGTYEYQSEFMRFHLATYAHRPWLNGAINWVLQDFKVRPDWSGGNPQPDSPWLRKGLLDEHGRPKLAYSRTRATYRRADPLVER